jgi:hypothetical protein
MHGAILALLQYFFTPWCLVKDRHNFTLYAVMIVFLYRRTKKKFSKLKLSKEWGMAKRKYSKFPVYTNMLSSKTITALKKQE